MISNKKKITNSHEKHDSSWPIMKEYSPIHFQCVGYMLKYYKFHPLFTPSLCTSIRNEKI